MTRHLLLMLYAVVLSTGLYAQTMDEDEQVLVFQHSGDINLFYVSELDSIVFSNYDIDSIYHDEVVSQLFYAKDTTLLVPIAEIDSVAFGNRNEMVLNNAVHELFDDIDFPWIIRTEDNTIFYRKDTPDNILPKVGDKLYYAGTNDFMPIGLAGKVTTVIALTDEITVTLEGVELNEVFDELFYAGRIVMGMENTEMRNRSQKASELNKVVSLRDNLDLDSFGTLGINGETSLTGDFVVNVRPFRPTYCHALVRGNTSIGFEWVARADESGDFNIASPQVRIPLPPIAGGVIHPVIYTQLFLEGKAELSLKYSMSRNFAFEYEWTRKDGKDEVRNSNPVGKDLQAEDEANAELLLEGELYAGAELGVELNLPGDCAGLIFNLQAGPYLKGELGFGVLKDLRNFDSEFHYNDNIDFGLKLRFGISSYTHDFLFLWGEKVEHSLYEHDFNLFQHSLHLFPEYKKTHAVQAVAKKDAEISVATEVKNEIPYEVETGFEIIDMEGEVLDSVFVEKPIVAKEADAQDFSSVFVLPEYIDPKEKSLRMRPIFHYAGYTISAESVNVSYDSNIMPITSYESNGVATFISGASVIGTAKDDNTVYHVGNYLPIPVSIYESIVTQGDIAQGRYISDGKSLIGTWEGVCDGEYISLTFNDDEECSGTYIVGEEQSPFTYSLNNPQSGDVRILFDEETAIVITVISISDTTLKYRNKNDKQYYELNKL